jgi:hypothetical protein
MQRIVRIALGAAVIGGTVLLAGAPAEARCRHVSAVGVGLGPEIAKEMAKMNLETEIAFKGRKAAGRTHVKCYGPLMSECRATRRTC